jgi:ATP-binding cassette subfamily B protein
MFKLLRFLKGTTILFTIAAPIMMFVEVSMDLLQLLQPTLMANIIDTGIANNDKEYVFSTGFKIVIAAITGILGGMACSVFASMAGIKFSENLRQELFNKIQSLSSKEIDTLKTSSLITRLTNDIMQIQNMFIASLKMMVRAPFLFIGSLIMSFILSPKLAIIFLISLPFIIISIILIMKKSLPLFLITQEKLDNINLIMRENILVFCHYQRNLLCLYMIPHNNIPNIIIYTVI